MMNQEPDAFCVTAPDGACVSNDPRCMHQPAAAKPTVHYRGEAVKVMGRAMLYPVDHPNHLDGHDISNTDLVTTSAVLSWVGDRIETKNTIYVPEGA